MTVEPYGVGAVRLRAASSTFSPIGAAMRPPVDSVVPGCASTMTATATRGASAGAKPMIHAFDVPFPIWAVPVLPAVGVFGTWSAVAVPAFTTATMASRIVEATSGETAVFHTDEWNERTTR